MNMYEKNKENSTAFAKFIKGNLINFCVIAVGIAYIFFGLIDVEKTDASLIVILCNGALGIVTGLLIKQALGENGYGKGYSSEIWQKEIRLYNDLCNDANPFMERVENFYSWEEITKMKAYRDLKLKGARLRYADFFDKYGNYINEKEIISPRTGKKLKAKGLFDKNTMVVLDSFQKRTLYVAIKVKVYNLNLFSEYENGITASIKKEMTDKMHKARVLGKNSLTSVLIACIGSYFTVQWLQQFDVAAFIFSILQVMLWVALGIVQLYNNYNYIVIDKVNKLKTKKQLIKKFIDGCNNNEQRQFYKENPYDIFEQEQAKEQEQNNIVVPSLNAVLEGE